MVVVWTLVFELMTIFQCGTHFSAAWDGTKLRYCTWSYPSIEGVAVSNVLLDLFVVALPIYPVRVVPAQRRTFDSKILISFCADYETGDIAKEQDCNCWRFPRCFGVSRPDLPRRALD